MSNLKRIRLSNELSQTKLAELSGVNVRLIQDYEQGHKPINNAKAITVYRLAEVLNCVVGELLEGVEDVYAEYVSIGNWLLACSNCDGVIENNDTGEYPKYCQNCGKKIKQIKKEVEE